MSEQVDRKDLKIQALLEKVASLTQNYENQVADLRVELTLSEQRVRELAERAAPAEVVEAEIVEDVPSPDA